MRGSIFVSLSLLLVAGVAEAKPRPVRVPAVPSEPGAWKTEQLADGIYAFVAPEGVTPVVSGNSIAIIGDDGVLVVDSTQLPSSARREADAIAKLTDRPVKYVVTTHWHPDHWAGNGELLARWPDAVLVSTASTRAMAQTKAQPFISTKYTTSTADAVEKMLAGDAKKPVMTPIQRAYYQLGLQQMIEYGGELEQAKIAPPVVTFDRELTIHLGAREVDVRFLGRGNTGGDAVVWVPDAKLVATGDLVVAPYPYAIGSFIGEWIDTLRAVEALGATTIVPGHGPVMHDTAYLDTEIALLTSLRDQAAAAVAKKLTLADARKAIDLASFRKQLCGDDPWRQFGFDNIFVAPGVARAFREATDGPLHDED